MKSLRHSALRFLLGLTGLTAFQAGAFGQATYDWFDTAPDANWRRGADGARWTGGLWDEPPSSNILRFNNNHQLGSNNNISSYSVHQIIFGGSNTSNRTISGNALSVNDWNGADPKIENQSTGTHTISLNLTGDSSDPLELNPLSGDLVIGGTINSNGSNILVYGANSKQLRLNGIVSGSGQLRIKQNSSVRIGAGMTFGGGAAATNTFIEAGELWLGTGGSLTGYIDVGLETTTGTMAKMYVSDAGVTVANNITVKAGNTDPNRVVGSIIASGTATYSGAITLQNDAIFESTQSGGTTTYSGGIGSSEKAVKISGPGTVILSGNNAFQGGVVVGQLNASSKLLIGHANALGTGTLEVHNTATVAANGSSNFATSNNLNIFSSNFNLGEASTNTGNLTFNNVNLGTDDTSTRTVTVAGGNHTFSGNLTGTRQLAKEGAGGLTLSGPNNTNTPAILVNNGTITISSAISNTGIDVGASSSPASDSNATLRFNRPENATYSGNITVRSGTGTRAIQFLNSSNTTAIAGHVTLAKATSVDVASGGTANMTRVTAGSSSDLLTKTGSGTLQLTGTLDNSNLAATVSAGTLELGKTAANVRAIGGTLTIQNGGTAKLTGNGDQIWITVLVDVQNGGTFDLNGRDEEIGRFTVNGTGSGSSGAIINSAATPVTLTLNTTHTASQLLAASSVGGTGNITFAGPGSITQSTLTKVGSNTVTLASGEGRDNLNLGVTVSSGTLVLAKPNSSTSAKAAGGTTVNSGGTLQLGAGGGYQIWNGATVTVNSGGAFDMNGFSQVFTSGTRSLAGTGISSGGALINGNTTSTSSLSGAINLTADTSMGGAGNLTINGTIAGASRSLTKVGAGRLTLNASNTFNGGAIVNGGTLAMENASALGSNALTLGGGTLAVAASISPGLGALNSSGTSGIDLGSGTANLTFSSVGTITGTLAITNWSSGTRFLTFTNNAGLTEANLSNMTLNGAVPALSGSQLAAATAAGAPTGLSLSRGNASLTATFAAPAATGGRAITNYQFSTDGGTSWTSVSPASASTSIVVNGLNNGQSYDVRVRAITAFGAGDASSTATAIVGVNPSLASPTATSIGATSATLGATVSSIGTNALSERGTLYGTSASPAGNQAAEGGTSAGAFSHSRTGLTPNTAYFHRGYATSAAGTAYSADGNFTTLPVPPTPSAATFATQAGFTANWSLPTMGNATHTFAIEVSTDNATFSSPAATATGLSSATTSQAVTGLAGGTTYYFRLKAVNATGDSAWSAGSAPVTTNSAALAPTVSTGTAGTPAITNVAITGSNVSTDGGETVTARGIAFATSQNPTTSNSTATAGNGTGTFNATLTGLAGGTTYYARAYATNSIGTSYGSQISFTTAAIVPAKPVFSRAHSPTSDGFTAVWGDPNLTAYEGFASTDYTAGLLSGQGPAALGFSGNWSGGGSVLRVGNSTNALSYANIGSDNSGGAFASGEGSRNSRNLSPVLGGNNLAGTNTYYISLLARVDNVSLSNYRAFEFGSEFGNRNLQFGAPTQAPTTNWAIRVNENDSLILDSGVAATANQTVLAVIKLTLSSTNNADSVQLWVNPSDPTDESLSTNSATLTGFNLTHNSVAAFSLASFSGSGNASFDEIRVGTTWDSVTSRASGYHIEHSANATFSGATMVNASSTKTSRALTGLVPGNVTYTRVRGYNPSGNGTWSDAQMNQLNSLAANATAYLSAAGQVDAYTISGIFGATNQAGLASGATDSASTVIMLLGSNGSTSNTIFYNSSSAGWREGATNMANTAVPQGTAFMLRNNSGSTDHYLLSAAPRTANFTVSANASAGQVNLLTPARSSATALNALNLRPSGGNSTNTIKEAAKPSEADLVLIPQPNGLLHRFHFDGTNWKSGAWTVNATQVQVPAGGSFFIRKAPGSSFNTYVPPPDN